MGSADDIIPKHKPLKLGVTHQKTLLHSPAALPLKKKGGET
jgi:hypothetical protein